MKIRPEKPRRIVAYTRVSTKDQSENGVSLAVQAERLRAYAVATDRHLDSLVSDDESGKTLDRPGIRAILEGVERREIGTVLVVKLDRLTRSTRDLGFILDLFQRVGADLISITESLDTSTAAGRMVTNMLGVVAQWEREAIGERTAFALAHKRRNGRVYSPAPFGFRRVGFDLVPLPEEQDALAEMRRLDATRLSYAQIAMMLTDAGYAPRGARWYPNTVRQILRSKMALERAI